MPKPLSFAVTALESRRLLSGLDTSSPAFLADLAKIGADKAQMIAGHTSGDASLRADLVTFEKALGASSLASGDDTVFDQFLNNGLANVETAWNTLAQASTSSAIDAAVDQLTTQLANLQSTLAHVQGAYQATNPGPASVAPIVKLDGEVASLAPVVPGFRVDMTTLNDQMAGGMNLPALLANLKTTASNASGLSADLAALPKDQADFASFLSLVGSSAVPTATKTQLLNSFLPEMSAVNLDIMGVAEADHSNDSTSLGLQLTSSVVTSNAVSRLLNDQATLANLINTAEAVYLKAGGPSASVQQVNLDTTKLAGAQTSLALAYPSMANDRLTPQSILLVLTTGAEKATVLADLAPNSTLMSTISAVEQVLAGSGLASGGRITQGITAALAALTNDLTGSGATALKAPLSPLQLGLTLDQVAVDQSTLDFWLNTAAAELSATKLSATSAAAVTRMEATLTSVSADIALLGANVAQFSKYLSI